MFATTRVGDGAEEAATSLALLHAVAAGIVPETIRVHHTDPVVAFGRRDVVTPGYRAAVAATRSCGFEPVERLAGGRAAVFHRNTLAFAWASRVDDARTGVAARFEWLSDVVTCALRRLGAPAEIGAVPGEYCPGAYSVYLRGHATQSDRRVLGRKVMGVGQRLVRRGAHVGGVIVVRDPDSIRSVLSPVYSRLGIEWDPATVGSLDEAVPGVGLTDVVDALRTELATRLQLHDDVLSPSVIAAGRANAHRHRPEPG